MYSPIPNGTLERIPNNDGYVFDCHIPPVGYGIHAVTGKLVKTDILKRSSVKSEQYWERTPLPDNWLKKRKEEKKRQQLDPDYYDVSMAQFEAQEWNRRLAGCWFWCNGKLVYLTGLHYFYLNWWKIDVGYPDFRDPDRKVFYVVQYIIEDPFAAGINEATKRRQGKTYRIGCFITEDISRNEECEGGIQSKTATDAKTVVFQRAVVSPFKKLPDFFIPVFDTSKGITPTSELRFAHTTVKGKRALENLERPELNSFIDWASSNKFGYDGRKKRRYGADEVGKTEEEDVYERHQVVRYCLETDAEWTGKAWYSTTVEDMDSGGASYLRLWKASDPRERDANGHTASGLYNYMTPAYETLFDKTYKYCDKFGYPKIEKAKEYFLNRRAALVRDSRALSSEIRKNPFNVQEMFRIDGDRCLFNANKLNERLEFLTWNNVTERGNFEWANGVRDSWVKWVKNANGRWEMPIGFSLDTPNCVIRRGNQYFPGHKTRFVSAVDPYDHDVTESNSRSSNAASFVLQKHNPLREDDPFNKAFISKYCARPPMASMMYEDILMQCVFFGCPLLYESQKPGIKTYFYKRGYGPFLIHLPGYKDPGIPSTPDNKQTLAELSEEYIESCIDKVYFRSLCDAWLLFDLKKTQVYDEPMGAGWTLVADMSSIVKREVSEMRDVREYFRTY